ncbi:hypothetical protein ACU635_14785 [[Actinomadura] parvosata]|uniref:hypothetical protein n=1 Tax=[Actinomadura] parvosata TaxID=1955412 RepID=UPI00406C9EE2
MTHLINKLGLRDRTQLAILACETDLVRPSDCPTTNSSRLKTLFKQRPEWPHPPFIEH